MIKTLYEIGNLVKDEYPEYFTPWQNPYGKNSTDKYVVIFHIKNGVLQDHVDMEKFSRKKLSKYLYRELAGARATSLVPTLTYFYEENEEKRAESIDKFADKVKRCLNSAKVKKVYPKITTDTSFEENLRKNIDSIKDLENKKNVLVTFKFDGNYVGEIPGFKKIIEDEAYKKYAKSAASDKVCAVTYKEAKEVWGRVSTLGFTVDDLPFSRNGFDEKQSYKMFPVSPEVVKILEGSRKFIDEKLSKNFYGLKYFLLPHFIDFEQEAANEVMDKFIAKAENPSESFMEEADSIINRENIIKEIIEEDQLSNNRVYYDIFFYQINSAQFIIKLHLSDVLPSRFKQIMEAKKSVEKYYNPITLIQTKNKGDWKFFLTLGNIKEYFSAKHGNNLYFHPYFFKIIEALFYGNTLNEKVILTAFYNEVKQSFKKIDDERYLFETAVKRSFTIFQYFIKLNLFKRNNMEKTDSTIIPLDLDSFLKEHQEFFSDDTKMAAFFLGCLTEKLLQKQRSKLHSEPFIKYLNGLSIDSKEMKKIHLKLIDKIEQYGDMFYSEEHKYIQRLNKEIAPRLLEKSKLSKTEISYAFATGLVMQKEFTNYYFENIKENKNIKK